MDLLKKHTFDALSGFKETFGEFYRLESCKMSGE